MDSMEILEIYNECAMMLDAHQDCGTTAALFKAVYPHPFDDAEGMAAAIAQADLHTSRTLEDKLGRAIMDSSRLPETRGEALLFRLRLENAVRILAILAQSKVPCEACTDIREEGALWALTTLWRVGRGLWVRRTAEAFRAGLASGLEPPAGR